MLAKVGISQYTYYFSKQVGKKNSVFVAGHVMSFGQEAISRYQKSKKRTLNFWK